MQLEKKNIFNEDAKRGTHKVINGETTNLREWNRIKYDWAAQLWKLMVKNFWVSDEVSMTNDATEFKSLTPTERRAFDKTIAFLNFLDSIQCENIPNLKSYITAPEIVDCLNIQTFQESIHAQSYSYVLESVCSPETREKIYDEWRNDTLMLERNRFIANLYQRFTDDPSDENFVRACMANFLLESLYFYSGFAFFYNLARNNKMTNTASMIKLIQKDELTHVVLFQNILLELQREEPQIFTDEFNQELREMTRTAVEWEIKWNDHITNNEIEGVNNEIVERYIKFIANNRMKRIGFELLYPEVTSNPMKWIEQFEDPNNTKQDFFQTTVTQYQKSNDIGWDEL